MEPLQSSRFCVTLAGIKWSSRNFLKFVEFAVMPLNGIEEAVGTKSEYSSLFQMIEERSSNKLKKSNISFVPVVSISSFRDISKSTGKSNWSIGWITPG